MPRLRSLFPSVFSLVIPFCFGLLLPSQGWAQGQPAQSSPMPSADLRGVVTDERGAAITRATVRLFGADGRDVSATTTDALGQFAFSPLSAPCIDCHVEVSRPGFRPTEVPIATASPLAVTLRVAPLQETVVVTATRGASEASLTGSAVAVIDRDAIDARGTPLVAELLRSTPSVTVVGSGGTGGVTSVYMRGGESDYNKILLDGIPLNEPGGTFNFSSLSTDGIERIEIVRGPMSGLFGSDAVSGVIQLFSSRGLAGARPQVTASVEAGTYATDRLRAGISGGARRWDYALSATRFTTDNRAANNAHAQHAVTASLGGPIDAAGRAVVRVVMRLEDQRTGVPGQTAFGRPDLDAFFDGRTAVAGVSLQHQATPRWRQRIALSMNRSTQRSANLIADAPYVPTYGDRRAAFEFFDFTFDSLNRLQRYLGTYQSDWSFGTSNAHTVTAALDVDAERATLEDRLEGSELPASRNNVGATAQYQFSGSRLNVSASVRAERNDSFGTAVVPRGSAAFVVRASSGGLGATVVRASGGLGIKEPTILESFSRNFFFLGNPELLPERSRSYDVGVEQRLFGDRARMELTYFDGRYRNQISTRTIDFSTFQGQYFNVGRTQAKGTEFAVETRPATWLRVRLGHTFLSSSIVESSSPDSPVFKVGAWTFRRPRHSGFLTVGFTHGRVAGDLSGVFSGRRVDSDFSALEPAITESNLPALWALNLRVRAARQLEAYARLENLLDAEYMDPLGYDTWRRTIHAGLRLTF